MWQRLRGAAWKFTCRDFRKHETPERDFPHMISACREGKISRKKFTEKEAKKLLVSSFDSNLLVYAHNEAASEHKAAKRFVEKMLAETVEQVLIVHQTLFELFAVLTSTAVFARPLTPLQAWRTCDFYLTHSSIQIASYEFPVLSIVEHLLAEKPQRGNRFFDLVFAATLKYHAVNRLYTRNSKDFRNYSFLEVINPI